MQFNTEIEKENNQEILEGSHNFANEYIQVQSVLNNNLMPTADVSNESAQFSNFTLINKSVQANSSTTFIDKDVQVVREKNLDFIETEQELISMTGLDVFKFLQS